MDIFGIGTSELIFIVIIAIIVLGPKDMQRAGKTVGRWLNRFVRSDGYKAFQRASREIRNLPTTLMREANIDQLKEMDQEIRNTIDPRPPRGPVSRPNPTQPPPGSPPTDAPRAVSSEFPRQDASDDPDQT